MSTMDDEELHPSKRFKTTPMMEAMGKEYLLPIKTEVINEEPRHEDPTTDKYEIIREILTGVPKTKVEMQIESLLNKGSQFIG